MLAVLVQRLIPSTPEEGCWLLPQHCTAAALSSELRARGLSPTAELLPQSWDRWDPHPHAAGPRFAPSPSAEAWGERRAASLWGFGTQGMQVRGGGGTSTIPAVREHSTRAAAFRPQQKAGNTGRRWLRPPGAQGWGRWALAWSVPPSPSLLPTHGAARPRTEPTRSDARRVAAQRGSSGLPALPSRPRNG